MALSPDVDNDQAVTCLECEWLGYAVDAERTDGELVCPDCASEVEIA